ncbi:conserved hypothetical protein [Tenacibaculum sp. 190524A02b]|uniref:Uncharacterized protein n=1 Tax=Tenacibaculum vairaonense TaxID=3137860 RepID=A0ABM9PS51_9FLAO
MSSSISIEESKQFVTALQNLGLVVIDKKALSDMLLKARLSTQVDKRVKWITKKEARFKYGVTRYWLDNAEIDPNSLLKVDPGESKNSTKKYNEQSIIDEQERRGV